MNTMLSNNNNDNNNCNNGTSTINVFNDSYHNNSLAIMRNIATIANAMLYRFQAMQRRLTNSSTKKTLHNLEKAIKVCKKAAIAEKASTAAKASLLPNDNQSSTTESTITTSVSRSSNIHTTMTTTTTTTTINTHTKMAGTDANAKANSNPMEHVQYANDNASKSSIWGSMCTIEEARCLVEMCRIQKMNGSYKMYPVEQMNQLMTARDAFLDLEVLDEAMLVNKMITNALMHKNM